jgi:tetratricopeptide (TPR) repeat protein
MRFFVMVSCFALAWISKGIAQGSSAEALPLSFGRETSTSEALSRMLAFRLASAEAALDLGFSGVAEVMLADLANRESSMDDAQRERWRGNRLIALLQLSRWEEAKARMLEIGAPKTDLQRMAWLLHGLWTGVPAEELELLLVSLEGQDVGSMISWLRYARGVLASRRGESAVARAWFDRALQASDGSRQRANMERLIWREDILSGERSETLAISLKSQIENAVNPVVAVQLVQQYAVVLAGLGRSAEAVREVERHLGLLGSSTREQRDRLLMTLALISDPSAGKGQVALEQLITDGVNERIRAMAFSLWLTQIDLGKGPELALLHQVLRSRTKDTLRAEMAQVLALSAYFRGDRSGVDQWITRVREWDESGVLEGLALRLQVGLCWSDQPPKYRLAAEYLLKLRAMEGGGGSDYNDLSMWIGDSYYLNGDHENARVYYEPLLHAGLPDATYHEVVFKLADCLLRSGNADAVRPLLDGVYGSGHAFDARVWFAEWNYNLALMRRGQGPQARERLMGLFDRFAESGGDEWRRIAAMRMGWLIAYLHFQESDADAVVEWCRRTLSIDSGVGLEGEGDGSLVRDELAVLEARALLLSDREAEALPIFESIREKGNPASAAASFLVEARHHWARGNAAAAQLSLMLLADRYPGSSYAPVALYEAALNVESRATPESDQEAVRLFDRIARDFPQHELHFISRLRQGDLLRKSNQFAAAVAFYEQLLQHFSVHPMRHMAEMSLGEAYLALGSGQSAYVDEAVRLFERLFDRTTLPLEFRVEAAAKGAAGLIRVNRESRAIELLWRVLSELAVEPASSASLGASGRYWLTRSALMLSELLERRGNVGEWHRLQELAITLGLTGFEE